MVYSLVKEGSSTTLICHESGTHGFSISFNSDKRSIVAVKLHQRDKAVYSITEIGDNISNERVVAVLEEMCDLGRKNLLGEYPKPMKFLHEYLQFLYDLKEAEDNVL
jgi:hypothetical protein